MNATDKQAIEHLVKFGALDEIFAEIYQRYYSAWVDCVDLDEREFLHAKASALKDLKQQFKREHNAN